jgi:hypothetical protein
MLSFRPRLSGTPTSNVILPPTPEWYPDALQLPLRTFLAACLCEGAFPDINVRDSGTRNWNARIVSYAFICVFYVVTRDHNNIQ